MSAICSVWSEILSLIHEDGGPREGLLQSPWPVPHGGACRPVTGHTFVSAAMLQQCQHTRGKQKLTAPRRSTLGVEAGFEFSDMMTSSTRRPSILDLPWFLSTRLSG